MEKKIARIYRWLDRCLKACSAGSWSSALLDMECAKAELEDVRSELWTLAESRVQGAGARKTVMLARVSCLSLILLLALAAPLAMQTVGQVSRPPDRHSSAIHSSEGVLEWVTGDEKALLAALRKSLSDANREWVAEVRGLASEQSESHEELASPQGDTAALGLSEPRPAAVRSRNVRTGGDPIARSEAMDSVAGRRETEPSPRKGVFSDRKDELIEKKTPSSSREMDSIITLVQIGQKALRERESPIRFQ